jgi:hypothetical protein
MSSSSARASRPKVTSSLGSLTGDVFLSSFLAKGLGFLPASAFFSGVFSSLAGFVSLPLGFAKSNSEKLKPKNQIRFKMKKNPQIS